MNVLSFGLSGLGEARREVTVYVSARGGRNSFDQGYYLLIKLGAKKA